MLEHTDAQIGRLVEFWRKRGGSTTRCLMVVSDNVRAREAARGVMTSSVLQRPGEDVAPAGGERCDDIGGAALAQQLPVGMGQAGNSPLAGTSRTPTGRGP